MDNLPDYLKIILSKMFESVNIDPKDIDIEEFTKEPDWFFKYQWTLETEKEFKTWFINYLKENKKLYKLLSGYNYSPKKKDIVKVVDSFCWNFGWKRKEE